MGAWGKGRSGLIRRTDETGVRRLMQSRECFAESRQPIADSQNRPERPSNDGMTQRYGCFFLLCFLLTLPALAQNIPVKGSGATLDVATWNIEWFGAANGPSNDALQLANVAAVIE